MDNSYIFTGVSAKITIATLIMRNESDVNTIANRRVARSLLSVSTVFQPGVIYKNTINKPLLENDQEKCGGTSHWDSNNF